MLDETVSVLAVGLYSFHIRPAIASTEELEYHNSFSVLLHWREDRRIYLTSLEALD